MTIQVIGIDPSTAATGLALPNGHCVTLKAKAGADDVAQRLHELYCKLSAYLRQLRSMEMVDVAVIEDLMPTGGARPKALRQLAFVGGVFRLALYETAIPYVEIHPLSVKKYVTGKGTAQKDDMIRTAKNLGYYVENDNEADAACLQRIGLDFYNSAEGWPQLESHQTALFEKLNFPRI